MRDPDGGVHALVGRNGVGKTTLLNAIAGLVEWRAGRILYDGLDLTGVPAEQRVKLGITLMSGGRSIFPTLSVEENIWIGAFPFHEHRAARRRSGSTPCSTCSRRCATGCARPGARCRVASSRWSRWRGH